MLDIIKSPQALEKESLGAFLLVSLERARKEKVMDRASGIIAGYDPGGNDNHGLAFLEIKEGKPVRLTTKTLSNAELVIEEIESKKIIGLGADTLTCWCTGKGGWRPADLWLRKEYLSVQGSVISPNRLSGSMVINGMAVLMKIRESNPRLIISETHPKVLYHALSKKKKKYNYNDDPKAMDHFLTEAIGLKVTTSNNHEWDAAISAYALFMGMEDEWKKDLHSAKWGWGSKIEPCGKTHYFWP